MPESTSKYYSVIIGVPIQLSDGTAKTVFTSSYAVEDPCGKCTVESVAMQFAATIQLGVGEITMEQYCELQIASERREENARTERT